MSIIINILGIVIEFTISYKRKKRGDFYTDYIKNNFGVDLTKECISIQKDKPIPTGNLGEQLRILKKQIDEVNNATN